MSRRGELPEIDDSPIGELCQEAARTGLRILATLAVVAAFGFMVGYAVGLR
jgi:hypothetical protein